MEVWDKPPRLTTGHDVEAEEGGLSARKPSRQLVSVSDNDNSVAGYSGTQRAAEAVWKDTSRFAQEFADKHALALEGWKIGFPVVTDTGAVGLCLAVACPTPTGEQPIVMVVTEGEPGLPQVLPITTDRSIIVFKTTEKEGVTQNVVGNSCEWAISALNNPANPTEPTTMSKYIMLSGDADAASRVSNAFIKSMMCPKDGLFFTDGSDRPDSENGDSDAVDEDTVYGKAITALEEFSSPSPARTQLSGQAEDYIEPENAALNFGDENNQLHVIAPAPIGLEGPDDEEEFAPIIGASQQEIESRAMEAPASELNKALRTVGTSIRHAKGDSVDAAPWDEGHVPLKVAMVFIKLASFWISLSRNQGDLASLKQGMQQIADAAYGYVKIPVRDDTPEKDIELNDVVSAAKELIRDYNGISSDSSVIAAGVAPGNTYLPGTINPPISVPSTVTVQGAATTDSDTDDDSDSTNLVDGFSTPVYDTTTQYVSSKSRSFKLGGLSSSLPLLLVSMCMGCYNPIFAGYGAGRRTRTIPLGITHSIGSIICPHCVLPARLRHYATLSYLTMLNDMWKRKTEKKDA